MRMTRDWAHAAFTAAQNGDRDAALGAVFELVRAGPNTVDQALGLWADRALIFMQASNENPCHAPVRLVDEAMEADSTGEVVALAHLPAETAWAGRMFTAYVAGDVTRWHELLNTVARDAAKLTEHAMAMLDTLAATANAYAEECPTGQTCCLTHIIGADLFAARAGVSHLN
jgi:hypothetical protein